MSTKEQVRRSSDPAPKGCSVGPLPRDLRSRQENWMSVASARTRGATLPCPQGPTGIWYASFPSNYLARFHPILSSIDLNFCVSILYFLFHLKITQLLRIAPLNTLTSPVQSDLEIRANATKKIVDKNLLTQNKLLRVWVAVGNKNM